MIRIISFAPDKPRGFTVLVNATDQNTPIAS
jgi:hypothetical protein